ncbi:MAG: hypothetical protein KJ065_18875 [Anaerolineae bacterium]|nr:hypothetical protein [Anaerolineae bacterium]
MKRLGYAPVLAILLVGLSACDDVPPCENTWFMRDHRPTDCARDPGRRSHATFMQFESGFMLWVTQLDTIYVLYLGQSSPRWQAFEDTFEDGMIEYDPALNVDQPPYTYQPRRGMGLIWRERAEVRNRLGWAVAEYEFPFETIVQTAADGTVYIRERHGGLFVLDADGADWLLYEPDSPAS